MYKYYTFLINLFTFDKSFLYVDIYKTIGLYKSLCEKWQIDHVTKGKKLNIWRDKTTDIYIYTYITESMNVCLRVIYNTFSNDRITDREAARKTRSPIWLAVKSASKVARKAANQ